VRDIEYPTSTGFNYKYLSAGVEDEPLSLLIFHSPGNVNCVQVSLSYCLKNPDSSNMSTYEIMQEKVEEAISKAVGELDCTMFFAEFDETHANALDSELRVSRILGWDGEFNHMMFAQLIRNTVLDCIESKYTSEVAIIAKNLRLKLLYQDDVIVKL
jgi:hypothetical protein